ncbi:MAG: tetratricopeptide repeat protein [Planctomycetota bacterium]
MMRRTRSIPGLPSMSHAGVHLLGLAGVLTLAGCSSGSGRAASAISGLDEAHSLARRAYENDDTIRAQQLYLASVEAYPSFASAWNNLGVLLMEDGRRPDADEAFAAAAQIDQTDPRPVYNRGLMRHRLGRLGEARAFYAAALERDPNYVDALMGHIECEITDGVGTSDTIERIDRAMRLQRDEAALNQLQLQRFRLLDELDSASSVSSR